MTPEQLDALIWFVHQAAEKAAERAKDSDTLSAWSADRSMRQAEKDLREAFEQDAP